MIQAFRWAFLYMPRRRHRPTVPSSTAPQSTVAPPEPEMAAVESGSTGAGGTVPHGSAQSQFRPLFLQSPGRPPIPWTRWIVMFEDWLLASGFPEGPSFDARKSAILRVSLGAEGFRLYSSMLPDVATRESYGETVGRLKKHFATPVSAIFARAQFTRHQQRPG